jgi:hypothetical protein
MGKKTIIIRQVNQISYLVSLKLFLEQLWQKQDGKL